MGWKDLFGKKKKAEPALPEPLVDLTLDKLKVGYFVDYDLRSWQVAAYNVYNWGGGEYSYEWQLKSHDETIHLEREVDDEDYWSISRPLRFNQLPAAVRDRLSVGEDPPDEIVLEGVTYYLEESSGGKFLRDGKGPAQEFLQWSYEDDDGKLLLSVEQWGEEEFEASRGEMVEPYQFSNILPGTA